MSRIDLSQRRRQRQGRGARLPRGATGVWTAAGVLQAPMRVGRADFGRAIALVSGDMAMIGAPRDGNGVGLPLPSWGQWQPDSRGCNGDRSPPRPVTGSAPRSRSTATRLVVGAPGRAMRKGAVFVFARQSDGSWSVGGDPGGCARHRQRPTRLGARCCKGDRLMVGAPGALVVAGAGGGSAGAAVVFERSSYGTRGANGRP